MKVHATLDLEFPGRPGNIIDPGWCNHTDLRVNDQPIYSDEAREYLVPEIAVGDEVEISIPSGSFTGRCIETRPVLPPTQPGQPDRAYALVGKWDGMEAGLLSGLSGLAWWTSTIAPDALVTTSASSVPVRYDRYSAARTLAIQTVDSLPDCGIARPERIREVLRQLLAAQISAAYLERVIDAHTEPTKATAGEG